MKLTKEQIKTLADRIVDTNLNVFVVARQMFDTEAGEEVFELLGVYGDIFQCACCDMWQGTCWKSDDYDVCVPCTEDDDDE